MNNLLVRHWQRANVAHSKFIHSATRLNISVDAKVLLARRLSLYLRSGVTIFDALHLIAVETRSASQQVLVKSLRESIAQGKTLSSASALFPRIFNQFQISLITIGEATGTLADNLSYLSELLKRQAALKRTIVSALFYPAIVALGTIAITLFLILFAFPKIMPLLKSLDTDLPLPTQILISVSTLLQQHWLALLIAFILMFICSFFFIKNQVVRNYIERSVLRLPYFGKLSSFYNIATISHLLSVLTRSGVRLDHGLLLVHNGTRNSLYKSSITVIQHHVVNGQQLTHGLRMYPTLYPSIAIELISSGEVTGNLSQTLEAVAALYEERLFELTKNLSSLVEPILMLFMGGIVGFVALAIILPMYSITQSIPTM